MQKARWRVAYWLSLVGIRLSRLVSARLAYAVATPLADLVYLAIGERRRNLIANLARVAGAEAAPDAARRAFRNYARYVIDFYQLPQLGRDTLTKRISYRDWPRLDAVLKEDTGKIFVTLHLGLSELGGAALAAYGHSVNVVAESLPDPKMDGLVQGLRRSLGMNIINARKVNTGVLRCLNRSEVLCLMFDVVEPGQGITVDFFGAPAEVSAAPARIALRTGARIFPALMSRDDADPTHLLPEIDFDLQYERTGDEERDVQGLTQALAASFERSIRQHPDQWFAFRKIWDAPTAQRSVAAEKGDERWKVWALAVAAKLGGRLPRAVSYGLARIAGDAAYRLRDDARANVEDNMRHVLGPAASEAAVQKAAREAFRNVARYYIDLIRLPQINHRQLLGRDMKINNFERLSEPPKEGRGVIVATAHFGNPELSVQVGSLLGLDILVLAEPLQPPALARMMTDLRATYGPRYENVSFSAVANAIRHLRAGGLLAITSDRDLQGRGPYLPFFGVETRMPVGAVELALRTGADLVPGFCLRKGNGFESFFEPPMELVRTGNHDADVLTNTRALIARVEEWLRRDPGQWMVLDRIWKPDAHPATESAKSPSGTAASS